MQIQASKLFDPTQLDNESQQKLGPLIQWMNQQVDTLVTALQRNLTIAENLRSEVKTIELESAVEKAIQLDSNKAMTGAIILQPPTDRMVLGFQVKSYGSGRIGVTCQFSEPGSGTVRIAIFY